VRIAATTLGMALLVGGCQFTNTAEETRYLPRDPIAVWTAAHAVARSKPRWSEIEACPVRGTLVYEARSALFGFVDDVSVSIDADLAHQGSVLHIDSRSRTGKSDLGANAKRIARFLDDLECHLAENPAVAEVDSGSRRE